MAGHTRAVLTVGAATLLPTIAGILILARVLEAVGEWISSGHEALEESVRAEAESYHWAGDPEFPRVLR